MDQIIFVLMLFVFVNCVLKLSFWRWWYTALFGLLCVAFVLWTQQYAILQSKTEISEFLKNKQVLQDMAVLISVESAICFSFCFTALRALFGKQPTRIDKILFFYPNLLIFPLLFLVLTRLNFTFTGVSFDVISYILAAAVFLLIALLSWAFKYFVPEKELRLELLFLVNLFVCILGLIATASGNVVYKTEPKAFDVRYLFLSLAVFMLAFLCGFLLNKLKWFFSSKKINNTKS